MSSQKIFMVEYPVLWRDLDANGHLKNTAYFEYTTSCRVQSMENLLTLINQGFGPVILKEGIQYKREFLPGDIMKIQMEVLHTSLDASYYLIRHKVYNKKNDKLSAILHIAGVWLDLNTRKIWQPTQDVIESLSVYKSDDFSFMDRREILQFQV